MLAHEKLMRVEDMSARFSRCRAAAVALIIAAFLVGCGGDKPEALVASAKEYIAKNDRNAAAIQLKNALQKNPDYAEARFLLGRTLLETGDLAGAEKELNKADELRYPFDQVAPVQARAMLMRGAYKKVIDEYSKAEVTSPQSKADLQTSLGQAWVASGDFEAARTGFAAALTAVPGYPPALLGEARLKAMGGDLPGAMAQVEAALAKSPKFVDGWQLKGDIAAAEGRLDDALAAYGKVLEIRPSYLPAHWKTLSILLQRGRSEETVKQLEALTKIAPKHPQTFYFQALYNFRERKYPAAREAVQQMLRADPNNFLGLLLSASIDYQIGSYAQSEASLLKVLQRAPKHKFARMILVNLYGRTGQSARAIDALKPLLEAGDDDSDVQSLAGEVFTQSGDMSRAARHFARAAALDPKSSSKRTALAMSHLASGENEQGFRELQDAADADSGIRADMALIAANTSQRKFDAALEAVDGLEKKLPGKALPSNLRGTVLVAKGDFAGARKSFEHAAALEPGNFAAASGLAKLDLAEKKPVEAKKRFEDLLAKDPKNAQALLSLAELRALAGGSSDEVAALIGKAVTVDPTNTAPRLALIGYYMRVNEPTKAVAAAQDALAAIPDRAELLYAAGQAQQAAGQPNQAAKSFSNLAQARPGSPMPYVKEAEAQIANKDYDVALQSLRKALALKPDLLEAQRNLIGVYLLKDNMADALAVAREVQKQRPKESIGYIFEGDIYVAKKMWNEAIVAYRKGLARAPATDLAARSVAAMRAGGKPADADKFISTWMKDHPKDREFQSFLAESAIVKGDFAFAAQQYKSMLDVQPDDALTLNNLAWVSGQLKDPKALEYAEKADKLAPNNPAILDTLGVLLVDKGETKRGIESLQRASALAPNAAGIRLNLARALIKDGQKDAGKKELDVLAKLGDKFSAQAEVTKLMQGL